MASSIPFPPHLNGPRMSVWAYFPFDGRTVPPGVPADWAWAMKQWDRVIAAGPTVRQVVVDMPYSRIDGSSPTGQSRTDEIRAKIQACTDQGQLVFGRVYVAGGRLALGPMGTLLQDPLDTSQQVPSVANQVRAWADSFGSRIHGIHLDSGPTACTDPAQPNGVAIVPDNYRQYASLVKDDLAYLLSVHAPRHPDTGPTGWLQALEPTFVTVWDGGVTDYQSRFEARDPCRPAVTAGVPSWWDPGKPSRWSRVHVVNDCTSEARMKSMVDFAITKRAAGTIWVTTSRNPPAFGPVFDVLPTYFESQVALFRPFVAADEANAPPEKTEPDKTEPDKTEPDKTEPDKTEPDKTEPDKTEPDKTEPDKTEPEKTEPEKTEPDKTEPDKGPEKEPEPEKFPANKPEKGENPPEVVKDHEPNMLLGMLDIGRPDVIGLIEPDLAFDDVVEATPEGPEGRTFIRADERPEVGIERADVPDDADDDRKEYGSSGGEGESS